MEGQIIMSVKEAKRISVLEKVINNQLKQKHAAKELNLSTRQIKRLVKAYKREGAAGLVHKSRGRESNYKIRPEFKKEIMDLVEIKYLDFSPTFATEKLLENHGLINFCQAF
mgnify:CR=1 FL=1